MLLMFNFSCTCLSLEWTAEKSQWQELYFRNLFLLASFRMVPTRLRHFVEFSSGGTLLNVSNEQEVQGWLNVKAALTLEGFLTLGQHKWNCQLLHMHVLLEAHMPAPCFNNSNQLCPQSKPAGAGQHTDWVTLEPNTAQAATANVTFYRWRIIELFEENQMIIK